jgi:hypothetical protein
MKYTTLALAMISIMFFQNAVAQQKPSQENSSSPTESKECLQELKKCNDAWEIKTTNYEACKTICHNAMLKCKPTQKGGKETQDSSFERAKRHRLDCVNSLQKVQKGTSTKPTK